MSTARTQTGLALRERAARIGAGVAAAYAEEVDFEGRFASEAMAALRSDSQLSALVPTHLGGAGVSIRDIAEATAALAHHCASTAMIYAMHQLSVACLVRHGTGAYFECYLRDLASRQLLLASATTELGTGGDVGISICAVDRSGGRYRLEKRAPVVSYGQHADAILVTARRSPSSPPSDQVLVLCTIPGTLLEPMGPWDAMGMRGTCSSGFHLVAEGDEAAVLPASFDIINAQTNHPVSHILWSHVWLGIAGQATELARSFVQAEARKNPGSVPPGGLRLAELHTQYLQMSALVRGAAARFEEIAEDSEVLGSLSYTIEMNALKVSASSLASQIVGNALLICGMAGYREDNSYSMGRLLRDAHGAAIMLSNDRLLANNARLLLVDKSSV